MPDKKKKSILDLVPEKLLKMSRNDLSHNVNEVRKKILESTLLSGFTPKVNGVNSGPRPFIHPSSVDNQPTNGQT